MNWNRRLICLSGLILLVLFATDVQAGKKPVKFLQSWKGSVVDETQQQVAPEVIANTKILEKVWKAWKIEEKMPKIDFAKEIVVLATTRGSRLNLTANLDDAGNLEVVGMHTLDLADGFRYVIAAVSRDGVKTVNKKELPQD
jgi:hypothetical protein